MIPAITWAMLATGVGVAIYILALGRYRWAIDGWNRACAIHREEKAVLEDRLFTLTAEHRKSEARADHYASSWGRIMRKLRLAEQANFELRTELVRRQTAEREAA